MYAGLDRIRCIRCGDASNRFFRVRAVVDRVQSMRVWSRERSDRAFRRTRACQELINSSFSIVYCSRFLVRHGYCCNVLDSRDIATMSTERRRGLASPCQSLWYNIYDRADTIFRQHCLTQQRSQTTSVISARCMASLSSPRDAHCELMFK